MKRMGRWGVVVASLVGLLGLMTLALATGVWGGQDLYHVPLSWCALAGSPVTTNESIAGDTSIDHKLWRRHERPTDGIYTPQAGISFRSAIESVWDNSGLNFPTVGDPEIGDAPYGDANIKVVDGMATPELKTVIQSCRTAWAAKGKADLGVTIVNIGLFYSGENGKQQFGPITGFTECLGLTLPEPRCTAGSNFRAHVAVTDNHYLFPGVPNRKWPDGLGPFLKTDPVDQLVGHELGHSLGLLLHRTDNTTALMHEFVQDNNSDGQVDNLVLNSVEVNTVRSTAQSARGLEKDPPGVFLPGRNLAFTQMDDRQEQKGPDYSDLVSLDVMVDRERGEVSLHNELLGLLPKSGLGKHVLLFNIDNDPKTGADTRQLERLGIKGTAFTGADLIAILRSRGREVSGVVFRILDDRAIKLGKAQIQLLTMLGAYDSVMDKAIIGPGARFPVNDVLTVTLPLADSGIPLGQTFTAQAIVSTSALKLEDRLDESKEELGRSFLLEPPVFPHCFPQGEGVSGGTIAVRFDGLKPDRGVHALIGAIEVARDKSDQEGRGTIQLPIPNKTRPGLHLITIGVDGTALTADCTVNVLK
jgi:hypothetical protein